MRKLIREEGEPTSGLGRKIEHLRLHHLSTEDYVDGLRELSILSTDWASTRARTNSSRVVALARLWSAAAESHLKPSNLPAAVCKPRSFSAALRMYLA